MAEIYRVVPLLEIGSLKIGLKIGDPIPVTKPPQQVVLSETSFLGDYSAQLAIVKDGRVQKAVSDGVAYQEIGLEVVGIAINADPDLKGKLRFVGAIPVSVTEVTRSPYKLGLLTS